MERQMRRYSILLATLLVSACIYGAATPARAEAHPFCLAGGPANTVECDYATLAQCQATAAGGLGYCVTNPGYSLNSYASYAGDGKRMR
jgi:hypothetical protein